MYLAEFSFPDTAELVTELLIHAPSEGMAKQFAQDYAAHWEMKLFSLYQATDRQVWLYSLLGKAVTIMAA